MNLLKFFAHSELKFDGFVNTSDNSTETIEFFAPAQSGFIYATVKIKFENHYTVGDPDEGQEEQEVFHEETQIEVLRIINDEGDEVDLDQGS